jgi:CheY-like chemotaxis protein
MSAPTRGRHARCSVVPAMGTMQAEGSWFALVADDDDDTRHLIAQALRRAQLHVCEACDGDELLSRYDALDALGSLRLLVVSDIDMPGHNGLEVARTLRHAGVRGPIVLVTGLNGPEVRDAARAAGADIVLTKPVDPAKLIETVQAFVAPLKRC